MATLAAPDPLPATNASLRQPAELPAGASLEEPAPADPTVPVATSTDSKIDEKPADPTMAMGDKAEMSPMTDARAPEPAMAMTPDAPPMMSAAGEMTPPNPGTTTSALFSPDAAGQPPAVSPVAAPVMLARKDARLTKPVQIPTAYGVVTLAIGTSLKVVSREGEWITLNHMGKPVRVPVSATDFAP
jgi:hypothetical protein